MKFFKHFTDAHRGRSLSLLQKQFGYAGKGRYWDLVEMCAEKLEKQRDEEFTEEHCVFEFEKTFLTRSLGFANVKQASRYLVATSELGLCLVEDMGDVWRCSMPKLLECLDRDAKRARPERGHAAPKIKIEDKEEDKEKEKVKKESPPTGVVIGIAQPLEQIPFSPRQSSPIKSPEDLEAAIPIVQREMFSRKFPDPAWVKSEIENCFTFHTADPAKRPVNQGQWMRKLSSWLMSRWDERPRKAASEIDWDYVTGGKR